MLGIVVATTGLVPILLWEVGTRPRLLMKGADALDAPPVPHRGWIIALFCVAVTGFVTETTAQVVSTLMRPLWLPSVEYYYDGRPAIAPAPNVLVLGPYVLLQPRITPVGIRGGVPGGGEIAIKWDEVRGYQFKSSYDRVD